MAGAGQSSHSLGHQGPCLSQEHTVRPAGEEDEQLPLKHPVLMSSYNGKDALHQPHGREITQCSSNANSHHSLRITPSPRTSTEELIQSAEWTVSIRILPPLLLLVVISYLDRTALSFASIQMSHDLQLSSSIYGLGSGAFFIAYAVGQIPSNFLLLRFGGPAWLAFICLTWGAAASCMALVRGPTSFVLLRMLLGLAESGAFPGTWYYVSCWYAADRTTIPYTVIETGITVSQVVAAPIAAGLLLLDGKMGLKGWQWLFLLEGVPAVLLGSVIFFWLPSSPYSARFLSEQQRIAVLKATSVGSTRAEASKKSTTAAAEAAAGACATEVSVAHLTGCVQPSPLAQDPEATHLLHRVHGTGSMASGQPSAASLDIDAVDQDASPAPGPPATNTNLPRPADGSAHRVCASHSSSPSTRTDGSASSPSWRGVLAVAKNKVVLYAGCWRILHDIPGNGVLYWTPKIVQALVVAAGAGAASPASSSSPGVAVVLLSAIPYAAASLVHLANAWHAQHVGESKLHITYTWLCGAAALLLLPFVAGGALSQDSSRSGGGEHASIAAFGMLIIAHVGVNGANGLQTGLVAGCLSPEQKALGLAMYNTIACFGSFLGPLLIGVLHDATKGYSAAMLLLGFSLAAAALMVYRFKGKSH